MNKIFYVVAIRKNIPKSVKLYEKRCSGLKAFVC